jgi:1,4-alpha-glucan branching enzyme
MKQQIAQHKQKKQQQGKPSAHPGMGARLVEGAVAFRVWAPHADEFLVSGTFNDWSATAHPLGREANGYWSVDVPGAKAGDEYRYLIHTGEQELWRIDPYAREVTNSVGNAVVTDGSFDWGDETFQIAPWNELVIYELHIGTFHKPPGDQPGNFYSAMEKLPYLRDLGINCVEIMPFTEFPGGFSWGYNPAHPFAIESDYGGPQAFKEFVKACHQHGIAVLVDVVYNHLGPGDLDLWRFDGWWEHDGGGIYFYNDWRAETPWGATRPDYGRGEVRQFLRDNAVMWIEEYHVDGLRWDATAFIRNVHGHEGSPASDLAEGWGLMQWIHQELQARYPNALSIAEDLRNNSFLTKPIDMGGAGFGAQWDGTFVHSIREAVITNDDAFRNMESVRDALLHRYDEDAFRRIIYTESHDEVANGKARLPEEIWPGQVDSWFAKKRSTLGAALVLTAPGVPMLFQGQEFLEDRWFHDQDPLEWARTEQQNGVLAIYRDLIGLRRNLAGTTRGLVGQEARVYHVNQADKVIAFQRWAQGGPGDSVIVIANFANRPLVGYRIGLPGEGTWQVRFNSDWAGYDPDYGAVETSAVTAEEPGYDDLPCSGVVNVGPYSVVILSQDAG